MTTFSLSLEYVGASHRTLFGILIETPFALGGLVVALVSWAGVRRWQTLSLVLSAPNLLLLAYWWLLPESPRWLIGKMAHNCFFTIQFILLAYLNVQQKKRSAR